MNETEHIRTILVVVGHIFLYVWKVCAHYLAPKATMTKQNGTNKKHNRNQRPDKKNEYEKQHSGS